MQDRDPELVIWDDLSSTRAWTPDEWERLRDWWDETEVRLHDTREEEEGLR